MMSHIAPNFDRPGFAKDVNVAFPIDRLREFEQNGEIGSVSDLHHSFMASTQAHEMPESAEKLSMHNQADGVTGALPVPV